MSATAVCVFDAYGTIFDVEAPVRRNLDALGDHASTIAQLWRRKQLEYSWLRTLMDRYVDFWQITSDALDFALEQHGIAPGRIRDELLACYLDLDPYPDVHATLTGLADAGVVCGILSNGSPPMLASALRHARLDALVDWVISVDEARVYKPAAEVYRRVVVRAEVPAEDVMFVSANGWDAIGAATAGLRSTWLNRAESPAERLGVEPTFEIAGLAALPALLGLR